MRDTTAQEVVDEWHGEDTPQGILRRQAVRNAWPKLGHMLDAAHPSDILAIQSLPDVGKALDLTPSDADKQQVEDWARELGRFFAEAGAHAGLDFGMDKVVDDENSPLWAWMAAHKTLPSRSLAITLGIRAHDDECDCTEPSRTYMRMAVYDDDSNEAIEDSAAIIVETPRNIETVKVMAGGACLSFSMFGTL